MQTADLYLKYALFAFLQVFLQKNEVIYIKEFKNRGHFCNYCRKILFSKCPEYFHHHINPAIWWVWEHPERITEFLTDLKKAEFRGSVKGFNRYLKIIRDKYVCIKEGHTIDKITIPGKSDCPAGNRLY